MGGGWLSQLLIKYYYTPFEDGPLFYQYNLSIRNNHKYQNTEYKFLTVHSEPVLQLSFDSATVGAEQIFCSSHLNLEGKLKSYFC